MSVLAPCPGWLSPPRAADGRGGRGPLPPAELAPGTASRRRDHEHLGVDPPHVLAHVGDLCVEVEAVARLERDLLVAELEQALARPHQRVVLGRGGARRVLEELPQLDADGAAYQDQVRDRGGDAPALELGEEGLGQPGLLAERAQGQALGPPRLAQARRHRPHQRRRLRTFSQGNLHLPLRKPLGYAPCQAGRIGLTASALLLYSGATRPIHGGGFACAHHVSCPSRRRPCCSRSEQAPPRPRRRSRSATSTPTAASAPPSRARTAPASRWPSRRSTPREACSVARSRCCSATTRASPRRRSSTPRSWWSRTRSR